MADETATPAADSGVQKGSEFSKPTGAKDDEVWARHFGKEAKEPKGKAKDSSATSERPRDSLAKPSKSEASSKEKTPASSDSAGSKDKPKDSSSKPSPTESKSEATKKPPTKSEKISAESEATGQKTAETDPEAPSKKAKDLYEEAKKSEDPREARKLYKRAMKEAFGEIPEEFDDGKYGAVRRERAAAKKVLDEQGQKNEGRINEAVEKLKPAIYVMRQLEAGGIADKLSVPLVEKAITVIRALKGLEDGDYTGLADVISKASGVDPDEAMKRFVRGVKVSPEGRAARAQAEQAQREAAETRAQLVALQRQLQERDTSQTEAQKKLAHETAVAENRARYIEDIQSELDGHPALKLPRGAERVLAYLIRTANPQSKSPRYSFEEAANRIVVAEKKRLQDARHLLDDGEDPPAPAARRLSSVARTETADVGVRNESPEAAFERVFAKHSGGRR